MAATSNEATACETIDGSCPGVRSSSSHGSDNSTMTGKEVEASEVATSAPPNNTFGARMRRRILHITPSWFSVNMGTGIASILLHNLPYNAPWLRIISTVIFVLNILIFLILASMTILRYLIWPRTFMVTLDHSLQSLFWGTLPMGFATIVNMTVFVCVPIWGDRFARLARGLWWIDVILTAVVGFGVPFVMFSRQKQTLDSLNSVWLQPIVAAVVAAASGGILADVLEPEAARSTVIISYFIWGCGVPFAFLVMGLYFYRLCLKGLPNPAMTPSILLPLGPCGQGSFGLIQLGRVVRKLAYEKGVSFAIALPPGVEAGSPEALTVAKQIADSIYAGGLVIGIIMWGVGLFWLVIAVATILRRLKQGGFPFSLGCWAFTFPLGVFSVATTTLATELDSIAFRIFGTFTSLCVVAAWVWVGSTTLWLAIRGQIFTAPELEKFGGQAPPKPAKQGELAAKIV